MLERLRPRLTYANVVSTVCLFILLGGSAFAAAKLTGRDIKNNSLTGRDVKTNSLTGRDVRGLRRIDFARGQGPRDGAPGAKGDQGPAGPAGPTGPSLGRTHAFVCDPNAIDILCSRLTLTLPQPGRVLLLLTGTWYEADAAPDGASGQCSVEADGTVVDSRRVGQNTPTHVAGGVGGPDFGTLAAQGVSDVLPAGDHSFTVECRQNEADIRFQTQLSAVALGPG
jgi:hypothetical protein